MSEATLRAAGFVRDDGDVCFCCATYTCSRCFLRIKEYDQYQQLTVREWLNVKDDEQLKQELVKEWNKGVDKGYTQEQMNIWWSGISVAWRLLKDCPPPTTTGGKQPSIKNTINYSADVVYEGNIHIKGNLIVDGTLSSVGTTTVEPGGANFWKSVNRSKEETMNWPDWKKAGVIAKREYPVNDQR